MTTERTFSGDPGAFSELKRYFATIQSSLTGASARNRSGRDVSLEEGCEWARRALHTAHDSGNKIMFIGNGGSAAIASHMANDYSKNGGLRSMVFNDAAALTCLGNDLGYENVFAAQVDLHARPEDLLVAISSSGRSPNILRAAAVARAKGCMILTCTGFDEDNDLRGLGDLNFYVPSHEYGLVEISHLVLCHAILDFDVGWSQHV